MLFYIAAGDVGTTIVSKGIMQLVILSYGFFSLMSAHVMFAISPLFGLKLDPMYYFLLPLQLNGGWRGKVLRVCVGILQGYHWTLGTYIVFITGTEFVSMSANILTWLSNRKNLDSVKYNSIRILVTSYNQIFAYLCSFILGCSTAIYVSSMNGMITSYGKIPLGVYSIFPFAAVVIMLCWSVGLNASAKVYIRSGEYIKMYKEMCRLEFDQKCGVRVLRSLKRVGIIFGSLGTVTKLSSLQLFDVWMDQTVDVLLASD